MSTNEADKLPKAGELLAAYVQRVRIGLGMSQAQLAQKVGIHLQSVGKIESRKTTQPNSKSETGLFKALQVSRYLEAVCWGTLLAAVQQLKCPNRWTPGTEAELM